jgi:hypothetical protein
MLTTSFQVLRFDEQTRCVNLATARDAGDTDARDKTSSG